MWLGDNKYSLCSQHCAEAWADDNVDGEFTTDGPRQCGGFIEEGFEAEPGDMCSWCKRVIAPACCLSGGCSDCYAGPDCRADLEE